MKRARLLLLVLAVFCTGTVVADERTFDPNLAKKLGGDERAGRSLDG